MKMKKYVILLVAALCVGAFTGCDEETPFPYIPYEGEEDNTPETGVDPETTSVTYRLDKVLLCSPENPNGMDIYGKLDFFPSLRMTVNISPLGSTVVFDNGDVPFLPFAEALGEGPIACELDSSVIPNELRIRETGMLLATYEQDGFTISFQLDSKLLTYIYKFKSL